MAAALNLGSALLDVRGDISATETLAGLDEGEAWESSDGGVRIRQITGVLNIAIALANSGDNVAESVVTGSNLDTHEPMRQPGRSARPTILTGPVDVHGPAQHRVRDPDHRRHRRLRRGVPGARHPRGAAGDATGRGRAHADVTPRPSAPVRVGPGRGPGHGR